MNWIVEVVILIAMMKYLGTPESHAALTFAVYVVWKIVGAGILSFVTVTIKGSAEVMKATAKTVKKDIEKLNKLKKEMKEREGRDDDDL